MTLLIVLAAIVVVLVTVLLVRGRRDPHHHGPIDPKVADQMTQVEVARGLSRVSDPMRTWGSGGS